MRQCLWLENLMTKRNRRKYTVLRQAHALRYAFIQDESEHHSVDRLYRAMNGSTSGYCGCRYPFHSQIMVYKTETLTKNTYHAAPYREPIDYRGPK